MRNDKCDRRLYCDDYKYYHCDGCNGNKINSEDFIKAFGNGVKEEINHVPTVEERPQGEWIPNYTSQFMNPGRSCSLCGKIVEFAENYCPNCGAKMRGD